MQRNRRLSFEACEARELMTAAPISIEAEAMGRVGSWAERRDSGASGKISMVPLVDNQGELAKTLMVEAAGSYSFTVTFKAPDLRANSFAYQVDSGPVREVSLPKTSGYQSQLQSVREQLAAGPHVLHVFARENGTRLDKFTFTPESVTVPPVDPPPVSSGNIVRVAPGIHNEQVKITSPPNGSIIDAAGAVLHADQNSYGDNFDWPGVVEFGHKSDVDHNAYPQTANQYPFTVKGASKDFSIRGGVVVGLLDPLAPWHIWKGIADGDGLRVEGSGTIDVSAIRIDNVEDGFSPHSANGADKPTDQVNYKLHDVYFSRIHDDMIENDATRNLDVRDVYMTGHTFYSSRGTANPNAVVNIDRAIVELFPQPHEGRISGTSGDLNINQAGGYPFADGLGVGSILKLDSAGKNGKITIKNSVFLVPRASTSSMDAMRLDEPDVIWQNVTVVWLGAGNYPGKIPPGVTITRDRSAFDQAKAQFFASHTNFADGTLANNIPAFDSPKIVFAYQPPSKQLP